MNFKIDRNPGKPYFLGQTKNGNVSEKMIYLMKVEVPVPETSLKTMKMETTVNQLILIGIANLKVFF